MTKYKIEWDPKESFASGSDGGPLGSHQKVLMTSTQCALFPCEYTVSGLAKGQTYHVRVFAYNQVRDTVKYALAIIGPKRYTSCA